MKRNLLFVVVVVLLLTGCGKSKLEEYSVNYKLDISNVFSENITFALPKNAYDIANDLKEDNDDRYPLEYMVLKGNIYPIYQNTSEVYKLSDKRYNNQVVATLSYNYPEKYYVYSNLITMCFENYDIISGNDYFEVKLSGSFSCNNFIKKLNIEVNSDYEVLESNGKKKGNKYTWSIDEKDFSNVDIQYKIKRDYSKMATVANNAKDVNKRNTTIRNIRIVVLVVMALVIIGFCLRFYFIKKESY